MAIGVRRMLRGPARCGPTMPLFSMPIAIDCVSPNPLVGEWQPPQVLSSFRPVIVSNQSKRPRSASWRSMWRPILFSNVELNFAREACIEENRFQLLIQWAVTRRVAAILSKGGGRDQKQDACSDQ